MFESVRACTQPFLKSLVATELMVNVFRHLIRFPVVFNTVYFHGVVEKKTVG